MVSLADGVGWTPIIVARVLPPTSLAPLKLWQVIYSFNFMATMIVQHCGLSVIQLSYLVKDKVVSTWAVQSKAYYIYQTRCLTMLSFLMTMHLCQEQLSLFLVWLLIISYQLHNLFNKLFPKKFMATGGKMFCLDFEIHITKSSNLFSVEIAQHCIIGWT